jgi:gliding motility-associated-like protein
LLTAYPKRLTAQQRCGTVDYQRMLRGQQFLIESEQEFEEWIKTKLPESRERGTYRTRSDIYRIPVVIHVIHTGETNGQGFNIPVEQIESQLNVLNKDFNRLNEDGSQTPALFQPLAGTMNIEFVLATQDPNGQPTSGINRLAGPKSSWTIADNSQLKSLSYWPAENYLNIWVCNLVGQFLGYAQFPVSTIPGLENSSRNRLTDGIVISALAFGTKTDGNFNLLPQYDRGRTLTHEMGHFFGLRHTWGDSPTCEATDYVDDTPAQTTETTGCPVHPVPDCPEGNPQPKMFQNYLDFTDDVCMNLFTVGQVERMTVVLENSPRRASLLVPLAAEEPMTQFPKIFSPNGDGINDFWLWTNTLDYEGCRLSIFNRFGKLVYETTSYDGTWNGRTNDGQLLEEEAYYYVIRCDGKNNITGGVRIVR